MVSILWGLMEVENNNYNEFLERLTRIETKIDSFNEDIKSCERVSSDNKSEIIALKQKVENQQRDIDELNNKNMYTSRTVIGAIVSSIGALILCLIKIGLGI